jgi:predicted HAD superfamily Cof-like phosphohydrolase
MAEEDRELLDVRAFHKKFKQIDSSIPTHLTKRKLAGRYNFMLEELLEGADAAGLVLRLDDDGIFKFIDVPGVDQDMAPQADALVDLVYVAKGTAAMMGLPWKALWDDVQRANMAKELGETHRKMGFGADVRKPAGWVPPMTESILREAGYSRGSFVGVKTDSHREADDYEIDDAMCFDDPGAK